jgi:type IV secretory pathway VirJ component
MTRRGIEAKASAAVVLAAALAATGSAHVPQTIALRGRAQTLRVYGAPGGAPIVVSSGDGGWMHLGPHVAQRLAARGFYVLGFDVREYLTAFTSAQRTLRADEVPADYQVIADLARGGGPTKPILVGVSEGAGLSVLAATSPSMKAHISGVVALGLPEQNELGWRWEDSVIYFTHKIPNEPTFSASSIVASVAPLPFAAIQSTHDKFVPLADIRNVMTRAVEPKRLWIVDASDHRFSDNVVEFDQRLLEAIEWIKSNAPR